MGYYSGFADQWEADLYEINYHVDKENCPKCGKPMKLKEGRYGLFYGCTTFPKCKFTFAYNKHLEE